jgi:hypothetical protein
VLSSHPFLLPFLPPFLLEILHPIHDADAMGARYPRLYKKLHDDRKRGGGGEEGAKELSKEKRLDTSMVYNAYPVVGGRGMCTCRGPRCSCL